jgi:hypothetical protein
MAEVPKKLDRCGVKHEIVALILMGIRVGVRKRRRWAGMMLKLLTEVVDTPTPGVFAKECGIA